MRRHGPLALIPFILWFKCNFNFHLYNLKVSKGILNEHSLGSFLRLCLAPSRKVVMASIFCRLWLAFVTMMAYSGVTVMAAQEPLRNIMYLTG